MHLKGDKMNVDMLQKKLLELQAANLPDELIREFTQLTQFITTTINSSSKKDTLERLETLTSSLLSLRDYMQTTMLQDSYRKFLISEVTSAINHVDPPEEAEELSQPEGEVQKKSSEPGHVSVNDL